MRPLRILLDANILVDAQLRDLFLRLAEAGAVDVRWSAEIVAEMRRALVDRLELPATVVRRLCDKMLDTFPNASVSSYHGVAETLRLPDVDDRHVSAAALVSNCNVLVTENVRDFPRATVVPLGIAVSDADTALVSIIEEHSELAVTVVERQVAALTKPPVTMAAFLTRLLGRAPKTAEALVDLLRD